MAGNSNKKEIIDEVSGWLRLYSDGTVDRSFTGPQEALFLTTPVPPTTTNSSTTLQDLSGEPNLRLYLPSGDPPTTPLPILLHFHGGGFSVSHYTWFLYYHFYSRLAAAIPAAILSAELPLAPEHRLPAAIHAATAALLRLRSLPPSLKSITDSSRVFLIGDSTGGNLVHEVSSFIGKQPEEYLSPVKLAGGVLINPGFVRSARSKSELEMKSDGFFNLEMLDKFLAFGLPEGVTKDHPYTCPMGMAAPAMEELRLPPFMVAVADGDLLRDRELEYCEAMKKAGKDVEVVISEGVGHSFYLNKIAVDSDPVTARRSDELIDAIKDFVARH
ncbi:probable carboxylesterase 15 [Dioscorea cayenensis subsp. rotundata]|uniref:Probable carboxylesterase 15 n=1 Tax=Dioscorea cayennensis subsp. rotundata TaxID=55577 RepID=A0AB40BMR7_DIOCR|nr:probable carboxylesterase 15 [Dioscorea cayenensis subsp. rotundata]